MKIYRGPATTDFESDSHVLVDQINLADRKPWTKNTDVEAKINKNADVRESRVTIRFEEADIDYLYLALVSGRINLVAKLESANLEVKALEGTIENIKNKSLLAIKIPNQPSPLADIVNVCRQALGEI